jgi:hypothetical protein
MDEIRILSPTAILGYGFPESSFQAGLAREPHLIAVDAGSTDPGPYYLGAGVSFTDRQAVHHDLRHMLIAGRERGIPVVFAALPVRLGFDPGLALHLGKILECAAIAATPRQRQRLHARGAAPRPLPGRTTQPGAGPHGHLGGRAHPVREDQPLPPARRPRHPLRRNSTERIVVVVIAARQRSPE